MSREQQRTPDGGVIRPPDGLDEQTRRAFAQYGEEVARFVWSLLEQQRQELLRELETDADAAVHVERTVRARRGQFLRLHPPPGGQALILPHPSTVPAGNGITVSLEAPEGALRVVSAPLQDGPRVRAATVNGAEAATYTTAGLLTFVGNGKDRWQAASQFAAESAAAQATETASAALDASYHLRAADARLPNARVATTGTEIEVSYTTALVSWVLRTASVTFAKLQNLTGLSVLGRAASSTGVMAAITASTARHVLRVNSGATQLEWGYPVSLRENAVGVGSGHHTLSFDSSSTIAANVIDGGSGFAGISFDWGGFDLEVNGSLNAGGNLVLDVQDGTNTVAQGDGAGGFSIDVDDFPLTGLADQAANTVVANATSSPATPTAFSVGANTVLGRAGGNIVAQQVATAQIANDAVDNIKAANMAQARIKGRAASAGTGDPTDLTAAQVLGILTPQAPWTFGSGLDFDITGNATIDASGSIVVTPTELSVICANTNFTVDANRCRITGTSPFLQMQEVAASIGGSGGFGLFWVLNLVANAPRFTDDAGVAWNLLRRVNVQVFTSDGTYTPTTGMAYCIAISTGGGGGSGGADCNSGTSRAAGGAGGGAGATCIELFTAAQIGASQTVTVGVGGTAGSSAGGNGGNGEDTTFGALHTAGGGTGGEGEAADGTYEVAVAGLGGTATGGLVNIPGGDGEDGFGFAISTLTHAEAGAGGASFWGGSGRKQVIGVAATTGAGNRPGIAGAAYGSGASGAAVVNNTTGSVGAAGKDGVCVVIEFI